MEILVALLIFLAAYGCGFAIFFVLVFFILRALGVTRCREWAIWAGAIFPLIMMTIIAWYSLTFYMAYSNVASRPNRPITASRIFSGPNQYPPQEFAAYGILAFQSRSSPSDRDRHLMFCEAYTTSLPHTSELIIQRSEQMVTVWPVDSDTDADKLNWMPRLELCEFAVGNYGLVIAKQALKDAVLAGVDTSDIGPFLLAWSPSIDKGKPDALVLVSNLSDVTTYAQAQQVFLMWSIDIENDPELWNKGWNIEILRIKIRYWVDKFGPKVLSLFADK